MLGTTKHFRQSREKTSPEINGIVESATTIGGSNRRSQEWDKLGNLTKRYDDLQSLSETFAYDGLNRLTSSTVTGQTAKTYTYDDIGNLTKKSDVSATAYTYGARATGCTQDPGPHAVSTASGQPFCYDANGNMIKGYNFRSSRARTYAWTTYNKPSRIVEGATTLMFSYGADRRRFKQVSSGGLTTLYVGGGLFEKRTQGTATTEVHHIQVQGRAVAVYTSLSSTTQSVRYLHGDHLGSIVLVTDEDGDVEGSRYSFDAFGRRRNGANWTDTLTTLTNPDTTRGYTGHEMLDTVDIVHMNGRIYDPFLGRVLSPDPFVQAPFDMQSFNRYTYVFNNPLSLTDPSGFLADDDWYIFDGGWTIDVVFHPGPDGLGTFEILKGIATRAIRVPGPGIYGGRQARRDGGGGGYYDGGGNYEGGYGGGGAVASVNPQQSSASSQRTNWRRTVQNVPKASQPTGFSGFFSALAQVPSAQLGVGHGLRLQEAKLGPLKIGIGVTAGAGGVGLADLDLYAWGRSSADLRLSVGEFGGRVYLWDFDFDSSGINNIDYFGVEPAYWDYSVGISGTISPYSFGFELDFQPLLDFFSDE